jgi:hypothetical protein
MNNGGFMKSFLTLAALLCFSFVVYGQPAPLPETAGIGEIFVEVVKIFQTPTGLSAHYKIASILFILVALFKNSMFQPHWTALGKWKPFVAPVLSLAAFLVMVQPLTLESVFAALTTGAAAGYFAQILDAVKTLPGVSSVALFVTELVGKLLKKPQ